MGAPPEAHDPNAGAGPRRRWLRFSIRHLIVAVTLLCIAFGAWSLTATIGVGQVMRAVENEHAAAYGPPLPMGSELRASRSFRVQKSQPIAPLVVAIDLDYMPARPAPGVPAALGGIGDRRYYVWLFGWSVEWPYKKVLWVS
jgi:hypothetical protein